MSNRYYVTDELNATCVWDGETGKCVETFNKYGATSEETAATASSPCKARELASRLNSAEGANHG